MSDLISRQAAIDVVEHITSSMSVCINTDECHGMKRMQRQAVIELANLPSAQPQITHCAECRHWKHSDVRKNYCEVFDWVNTAEDFCSFAERKENR